MKYILLIIAPFLCFSQTVWDGEMITFSKAKNNNITDLRNFQDIITDMVD